MKKVITTFSSNAKIECQPDGIHLISMDSTKLQKFDFIIQLSTMKEIFNMYFPMYLESISGCPDAIEALKKFVKENSSGGF